MRREVSLSEISDGKLYGSNDMVKADCNDCVGCSACCRGMGGSIILDPFDVYRLLKGLGGTFEKLLAEKVELNVVDGIILPNLKMAGKEEACAFLNEEGRCGIHSFRPGICRLFPLGRYYENHGFQYFLQVHECGKENRTKIKVRKWIDTPELKKYEAFIVEWHYFLNDMQELAERAKNDETARALNLYLLKKFFFTPYEVGKDFYEQFYTRLEEAVLYTNQNTAEIR